jgi:hypothetical protein
MRSGGNFNPEWGYLAPAPSFMRTARIVVVATAIGATAGAGVVLTLASSGNNLGLQADTGKSLVVVRSLVQPAEAATATTEPRVAPIASAAPIATPVVTPQPAQAAAQPPQGGAPSLSSSLTPPPPAAQVSGPASSESRMASTSAVPASVAALAEMPPVTDVSLASSTSQALFAPDQTGAAKLGGKPFAAASTSQSPVAQTAPPAAHVQPTTAVIAKKKTEEQGLAPLLRHLFSARAGNT